MSVQIEKLGKNMAKLTIEVATDKFEAAIEQAYHRLKGRIQLPGLRKGTAPRRMIEKVYGASIFFEDAADILIPKAYEEALAECGETIVSRPEIDITQAESGKPFIFTAEVALKPEVVLGEYKGLEVPASEITVTDEEVEAEVKRQQEQATDSEDSQSISQKIEALSFAIRKANIKKEEIAMNTAHIQESAVFRRLQEDPTIARSDEGIWSEVEAVINEAYPGFTDRLRLLLPKMSGKEWQVSLLLKAQLTHQLIAEIICETQGGESNIRRRLSKKLFPSETPSSSKFDDFIGSL